MSISTTHGDVHQEELPHESRRGRSDCIHSSAEATLDVVAGRRRGQHAGISYSNTSATPTSSLVEMTHRYSSRIRLPNQSPDPDIKAISHSVAVNDAEHILSYSGTSQYKRDGTGTAACGLAALNFARIVFSMEQSGLQDTNLLQAALARACAEVRRRTVLPY